MPQTFVWVLHAAANCRKQYAGLLPSSMKWVRGRGERAGARSTWCASLLRKPALSPNPSPALRQRGATAALELAQR